MAQPGTQETTNCDNFQFLYDAVLYYEKDDPDREKVEHVRRILESDTWGVNIFDPHRSEGGNKMETFKQSFGNSRHAVVFLTRMVLQFMKENKNAESTFRMSTFLCQLLSSHDKKLARRLIPVKLTNERAPFILCDLKVLEPEQTGFKRRLFRCLSVPPGAHTPSQQQVRQKLQLAQHTLMSAGALRSLAARLQVPPDILAEIQQEYGGWRARVMEVVDCWRTRYGTEATVDTLDQALRSISGEPQHDKAPWSILGEPQHDKAPWSILGEPQHDKAPWSILSKPQQEEPCLQSPVNQQLPEDLPSTVAVQPMESLSSQMEGLSLTADQSQGEGTAVGKKSVLSHRRKEPAL